MGSKSGDIRLYGKPGVETYVCHEEGRAIKHLFFSVNEVITGLGFLEHTHTHTHSHTHTHTSELRSRSLVAMELTISVGDTWSPEKCW